MKNSIGSAKKIAIGIMALGFSQAALSESNLNISGWVNEGMVYYDDGVDSDTFQTTDNGTTLNSRITFSASADVPNTSMKAGMEIILEPNQSSETPLLFSSQSASGGSGAGDTIGTLGKSIYLEGSWGKVTMGLQSMPTDN
ncbi:MAG: porin, partial [Rhodocyclaceae bacterium]|nr:porin [Rhodocyclaceae bacterium]